MNTYSKEIENLPIYSYIDDICIKLKESPSHFLILTAQTAAGKSTALPLALLSNFEGSIAMLEPRRLAALNIASRVSHLLGEEVGQTSGYVMHLENKTSGKTRFTVMTQAVLVRKIQSDPSLEGISVVVLDEFHERSLYADLSLAFLKEAMALRDDLYVVVMSATIDTKQLQDYLDGAPVYFVPGRQFPVEIKYAGDIAPSKAVLNELNRGDDDGSILVFLPGIADIRRTKQELEDAGCTQEILTLHSSVPFDEQKKVLGGRREGEGRRVILSSAIAETSLTVPDITVVIDSGLERVNIINQRLGMETLVTRRESVFNAEQRTGRAGRVRAGRCIRLWNENDVRIPMPSSEISRTDLTSLVLECFQWGVHGIDGISWLERPSKASWDSAVELLRVLGCLESKDGSEPRITALGSACLAVGLHPRLACVAISGLIHNQLELSTGIAINYSAQVQKSSGTAQDLARNLISRVQKNCVKTDLSHFFPQLDAQFSTGYALLCGFPDRIAVKVQNGYMFPSGRTAVLPKDKFSTAKYIVASDVDGGTSSSLIYEWEELDEALATAFLESKAKVGVQTSFVGDTQKLQRLEVKSYGRIVLSEKKLPVDQSYYMEAVEDAVARKGLDWLPMDEATKNFLVRVQFYIQHGGQDSDKYSGLEGSVKEWLSPFVPSGTVVGAKQVHDGLYWYLDGAAIDKNVPCDLVLPNGRRRKIVYEVQNGRIVPFVEVIIQQVFGCFETPTVMGEKIVMRLLSPARRPLQVTSDLENFWAVTWPEVCKEMKGRYPKHNWDYRVIQKD